MRHEVVDSARLRSFYSSSVADYPRSSRALRYPRWVNTRGNPSADDSSGASHAGDATPLVAQEPRSAADRTVHLTEGEDDPGRGSASSSSAPPASGSDGASSSSGSNSSGSSTPPSSSPPPSQTSISKQSVPEFYPQVLALPIARRPLFPGFYKAVVVRNPAVVAAIKDMMKRGQPYLGAFLLKDENADSDVITDISSVHPVGVFAQITSVFAATGKDDKEEGLTAVLYPHRRIRLTELVRAGSGEGPAVVETVEAESSPELPTPPSSPQSTDVELPQEDAPQERKTTSGE